MKICFLGTGTSTGIPVIGSTHPVSFSKNKKDKRLRSSCLITTNSQKKILIDCGPDFRQQMLNNEEHDIDSVLITHEHNDHIIGLDDLRPIIFKRNKNIPIYALPRVCQEIKNRFPYAFSNEKYPGAPSFDLFPIENEFEILDTKITPIHFLHGKLPIIGFKIKNMAYITDASFIPEIELEKLKNLDLLIINSLRREEPHHSHFILPETLSILEKLKPKEAYLTHISQQMGFHDETNAKLPSNVHLAYDGLELNF